MLAVGLALGSSGPPREGFINWAPYQAEPWGSPGIKHADTDGDGSINVQDLRTTQFNYGLTNSAYEASREYTPGPELLIESPFPNANLEITEGEQLPLRFLLLEEVPDLKGLAFSMEYDPRYFQTVRSFGFSIDDMRVLYDDGRGAEVDFAQYMVEADSLLRPGSLSWATGQEQLRRRL